MEEGNHELCFADTQTSNSMGHSRVKLEVEIWVRAPERRNWNSGFEGVSLRCGKGTTSLRIDKMEEGEGQTPWNACRSAL